MGMMTRARSRRSRALLVLLFILVAGQAQAQIVQSKEGTLDAATVTMDTALTTGNSVLIIWRSCDPAMSAPASMTDASNTYALAGSQAASGNNPVLYAYYKVGITGGNTVITAGSPAGCYSYLYAIEITSTYSVYGSFASATATGATDIVSGAITTPRTGLLITFASQSAFATYTAGTNYTLINGGIVGAGGAEYYVAPALTAYVSHITSDITNLNAAVTVAFLTAAQGGGLPLLGVGK